MAQTAVDVVVRVKDLAALDRLKKSLAGVDGATLKASQGINKFENSIKRLESVLGGLAVGDQLRRAFGAAADFSATEARLNNVVKKYEQFAGIQELAAASAQKFGISNAQAASDLADLGSRLGSTGANLKDLNDIYEGFNTLLAVNQVGTQQAAAAQLQLNQALGSGKLAGDEFRSIAETTPQLLDELAVVLGVTRDQIKKLGSDGKITSKVLVEALGNIAEDGGQALADFFKTPAGQLKLFDKAIQDFQVTIGQQLLPIFTPIISAATTLIGLFSQLPGPIKATAVAVTALGAAFAILGGPITAIVAGIIGITLAIKKLADENEAFAAALQGAWNNILAGLEGVGAFFQAFFSNISQQGAEFIAYWSGLGNQLAETWNQGIANITEAFGRWQGYFNEVVSAIANAWNQLMSLIPDAFFKAVSILGEIFSPFVDFLNRAFGAISNAWNSLLQSMAENWGRLLTEMIGNFLPFVKVFRALGIDIGEGLASGVKAGFEAFSSFQPGKAPSLDLPGVSGLANVTPPDGGKGGKGGKKGRGGKSDAERELERQLKLQEQLLKGAQDLLFAAQEENKALQGQTEYETALLEASKAANEIKREYAEKLLEAKEITDAAVRSEVELTLQKAQGLELTNNDLELQQEIADLRDSAIGSITDEIQLLEAKLEGTEEELKMRREIAKLTENGSVSNAEATALVERKNALEGLVEKQKELKEMTTQVASTISSAFTSAFRSVIDGSKSAQEALSDAFTQIGNSFVDMALKIIEQQLTMIMQGLLMKALGISMPGSGAGLPGGGFGAGAGSFSTGGGIFNTPFATFADGGFPPVGKPSIVGEEGPEIFIPQERGLVLPNDIFEATKEALKTDGEVVATSEEEQAAAMASNNASISNTYNSSTSSANSSTSSTSTSSAFNQNSKSINSTRYGDSSNSMMSEAFATNNSSIQAQKQAATATLERESMQQMINAPSKMTVAYESTVINQQEYVTAEQHQKGVTQAAMKGRDMALASLKNSVRARKQVGLA